MTPELLETVTNAWADYVQSKVSKALQDPDKPASGSEKDAWPHLVPRFQSADKTWKQECLKRDEKFEMHFSAAVRNLYF